MENSHTNPLPLKIDLQTFANKKIKEIKILSDEYGIVYHRVNTFIRKNDVEKGCFYSIESAKYIYTFLYEEYNEYRIVSKKKLK